MPTYTFECQDCREDFEMLLKISEYNDPQTCPACGSKDSRRTMTEPPGLTFVGDGWTGKNLRIAGQMREKNKRLESKEREYKGDGMIPQLAPNVDGQRVGSWSDAKKLAGEKGKNTSGYDSYVRKESNK